MSEWINTTLGNVLNFRRGHDLPKSKMMEGKYPVVGSNGIIGYHNEYTTEKPCVTIGRSGNVGNPNIEKCQCWAHNTTLYIDNFKSNDEIFIYYFLLTLNLANYRGGSAVPTLNRNHIHPIEVKIPPLPTQRRIAAILSSLDDKIENNRKAAEKLEEIAQAIFKRWFVDFEFPNKDGKPYKSSGGAMVYCDELGKDVPKWWRCLELSDVSKFQNGYAFKSKELLKNKESNCYDVFKMGHIKRGGGFKKEGTKNYIEKNKCINLKKYVLKKGDLMMSMTDMKDNVAILGNTALVDEDERYIVNQRVGLIRSKNMYNIDYPFLYFLTNSILFNSDLRSRANRGVQVNLSTEQIKASKLTIPVKKTDLLKSFDDTVKPMLEICFQISMENQSLKEIRDALLPKLMSGEIDIDE